MPISYPEASRVSGEDPHQRPEGLAGISLGGWGQREDAAVSQPGDREPQTKAAQESTGQCGRRLYRTHCAGECKGVAAQAALGA